MALLGSTFGALYPALLILGPIFIGVLVYAYLRRGQGQRILVASTLLLKSLRRKSASRKKFVPPPRFFYELLILLFIFLASLGLYRESSAKHVALIIDNSFSMLAKNGEDGGTALADAEREASAYVNSLPSSTLLKVFTTSPAFVSSRSDFISPDEASRIVEGATASYGTDNLDMALRKAASDPSFERIIVFTDKVLKPADASQVSGQDKERRIELHSVRGRDPKRTSENIAISDLSFRKGGEGRAQNQLLVTVSAYTRRDVPVIVTLEQVEESKSGIQFTEITSRKSVVKAGQSSVVGLDNIPSARGGFRVRVAGDGRSFPDAIAEDNEAWVSPLSASDSMVLVSDLSPDALGLSKIKTLKILHVKPEEFDSKGAAIAESGQTFIFHRIAPSKLPPFNSLFILPSPGNEFLSTKESLKSPEVTRWASTTPLLDYVNLTGLSFPSFTPLKVPDWAREIITTTQGVLAFAGELGGKRYAAFGVELFPYEGKKSPAVSILTLNALKWLSDLTLQSAFRRVNSSMTVSSDFIDAHYFDGDPIAPPAGEAAASSRSIAFEKPGLVAYRERNKETSIIAVDFFDSEESDTLQLHGVVIPGHVGQIASQEARETLSGLFGKGALLLIFLEILMLTKCFGLLKKNYFESFLRG